MNIRNTIKTSSTIPYLLAEELKKQAKICGISQEKLARRVLLQFIRHLDRAEITGDNVVSYNKRGSNCKPVYFRWDAKEYAILQQLRLKTRFSVSFILAMALRKFLNKIVRAILRKKGKNSTISNHFFVKQLTRLRRFFIYWPNIDTDILPFFQIDRREISLPIHLDYEIY